MHLLDCLTSRLCATHIRLFSLSLHSRNSAVLFRFHHRAHPSNILPAKITRSVHLVCFASLEPRTEQAKKKEGKLVCVRSLLARDHKQGMQSILAYNCTNTDTRHLCVVTCSRMQTRTQLQYKNARQALLPVHYLVGTYSPTLIHLFRRSEKRFFWCLLHIYI